MYPLKVKTLKSNLKLANKVCKKLHQKFHGKNLLLHISNINVIRRLDLGLFTWEQVLLLNEYTYVSN